MHHDTGQYANYLLLRARSFEEYLRQHTEEVISLNRLQFCVGRLETARLAISERHEQ